MDYTIKPEQMKWGSYRDREGCFHLGTLKVEAPKSDAPFAEKVVALVAAAEGGAWNSMNMYDSGLLSLGAIQFIDSAPQFFVTDMLDSLSKKIGEDAVRSMIQPALQLVNAEYKMEPVSGKYKYFIDGKVVATKLQQNILYFGDSTGNVKGTFDAVKKKICRTWGSCIMNLMTLPGAIDVQAEYTYKRILTTFLWGKAKPLFNTPGLAEYGWQAAIRALVVSYAVNSPATAMRRVDAFVAKTTEAPWTPIWCLEMLRAVAVDGGIKIWSDRYKSQITATKNIFGVELPSWNDLVARSWKNKNWSHPCLLDVSLPAAPKLLAEDEISNMLNSSLVETPLAAKEEPVAVVTELAVKPTSAALPEVSLVAKKAPGLDIQALAKMAWPLFIPVIWLFKWIVEHFKKH